MSNDKEKFDNDKKKETLNILDSREVLGNDFKVYGTAENPLFLAKDVAEWIDYNRTKQGYYDVSAMLRTVDSEEKMKIRTTINNPSGSELWLLTEDGLYEVLMQSRKPIAKAFKKEVKKILKEIRLTGGYIPTNDEENDDDILAKALVIAHRKIELKNKKLAEQKNIINMQKEEMYKQETIIIEQAPKVEYHDTVLQREGLLTITDVAKKMGTSAVKLNIQLRALGIIYKQGNNYKLYAKYQNKVPEYFDYHIHEHGQTLKITEKGRKWLIGLFEENNIYFN